jgi:hypothetical protein
MLLGRLMPKLDNATTMYWGSNISQIYISIRVSCNIGGKVDESRQANGGSLMARLSLDQVFYVILTTTSA